MSSSKYILICFQEEFENTNNLKYFKLLKSKLSNKFEIILKKINFIKVIYFINKTTISLLQKN